MSTELKGVLFDLDGTLADTYELILASFRYATQEVLGRTIPDSELMAKVGQPLVVQMWDFADDEETHDKLFDTYLAHNATVHDKLIRSFPGVRAMLDELRDGGLAMGVVTSKRHAAAERALESIGLGGYFPFIIGADDWPAHKPDPGSVLHGCDLLGIAPKECAYVGDSPFDMQAGNAAGCFSVAVMWGMFSRDELMAEHPCAVAEELGDLSKLLLA